MSNQLVEGGVGDMAALAELRAMVGWGPGADFGGLIAAGRALLLLGRDETGGLVASGAAVSYGPLGFIGSMITLPEWQGQGVGRDVFSRLMAWLAGQGCRRVELEATPAGRRLYEHYFGFRRRWDSFRATLEEPSGFLPDPVVRDVQTEDDWREVLALDRAATGGEREVLLRSAAATVGVRFVVLPGADGADAYGMLRGQALGPVIGRDAESAARVVRTLAAGTRQPISAGTGGGPGVREMWEGLGFVITDFDTRMTWGTDPDDRPEMLYALFSGGLG